MNNSMKISVIGPSRDRYDKFIRGVDSLINNAQNIDNIEFIFRFDDDDMDNVNKIRYHYANNNLDMTFLVGERHGYRYLDKYWDELTGETSGEYILHWSDDYEMASDNKSSWDSVIREFEGQFYVLDFPEFENKSRNHTTCFTFPRKLWEMMGNRLCPNLRMDRWFNNLYTVNDIWVVCEDVKHINRDCFSGRAPADQTYREGRAYYNKVGPPPGTDALWTKGQDALKLKKYLDENPNTKVIRETNKFWLGKS